MKFFSQLLAGVLILNFFSCSESQKKFSINGNIDHLASGSRIYLDEMEYNKVTTLDTTKSDASGKFSFTGFISHPGLYRVRYGNDNSIFLVMDERTSMVELNGDTMNLFQKPYAIKGSPLSVQFLNFFLEVKKIYEGISEINSRMNDSTGSLTDSVKHSLLKEMQMATDMGRKWLNNYVDTTTSPVIAVFALSNFLNPEMDKVTYEKFLAKAKSKYTNVPMAVAFCEDVELAFKKMQRKPGESLFENGTLIPEINIPDVNGKNISLQSLKGKYVLVDFWASWCMPCRKENPNVVEAYNKYKDKGFTVYSISLDDDIEKWKKAIEQDHLSWPYHVSELKGWESEVVHQFGIEGIPTNYLIDKEGIIIASNLRGKELENILTQVIK